MKTNKKEHIEAKIARSKARIEARNQRKAEAKLLQGVPMIVFKEGVEARVKAWKEIKVCQLVESRSKTPMVIPKDFYSEELKSRRKAKRERLKALLEAHKSKFKLQSTSYFKDKVKQIDAQAKWDTMILHMKEAARSAKKQSVEDKAKYKASLVAFKEAHVRTNKVQENNILDAKPRHKKNRKAGRKSTAKVYSIKRG